MRIKTFEYNPFTDSLDVYVSGCRDHPCKGCHNPELWDFGNGQDFKDIKKQMYDKILALGTYIERIFIYGGEPLDQNKDDLISLLWLLESGGVPIWLFTRYEFEDIPDDIMFKVDYIKTGPYIQDLKTDNNIQYGIKLASSNQKIYKI